MVQKIVIPSNVPVNDLALTGNIACSNTLATTNIFSINVFVSGNVFVQGSQPGLTTLSVTGNAYVANAVTTTNMFARNLTAQGSLVTGNVFASNAVSTGNVFGAGNMIVQGVQSFSFNMSVTGNAYISNALTTNNVFSNVVTAAGVITGNKLGVVGNVFGSNSVTTMNIYVSNILVGGNLTVGGMCTVTGNAYVANAVVTTNVWANAMYASNISGDQNVYSANSITTTNVWTTNIAARNTFTIARTTAIVGNVSSANLYTSNLFSNIVSSGILRVTGDQSAGTTTLSAGNIFSANALTTTNVMTSNITSQGIGSFSSVVVTGNVYVSNAVSTTNVFSGTSYVSGFVNTTGAATTGVTTLWAANVTVSNTLVVSNVYSTLGLGSVRYTFVSLPFEYTTTIVSRNNTFVSNTTSVQNAWFSSNVYCQKTLQIGTLQIHQDATTGGLFTRSLTRRTNLPMYREASSAPAVSFNGDEYYNTSTLALNKFIGGTWRTIGYPVLATPVITQLSTQTPTIDSTLNFAYIASPVEIQVVQTAASASVGQLTWSISGQPSNVYLTNQRSTGCSIIVPAGVYPTPATYSVIVTAQNRDASASMTFSLVIPAPELFAFTAFTFLPVVGTESTTGPTLGQCQSAYSGTPWITSYFNQGTYQGYQRWTVPAAGSYYIVAGGAGGGANGGVYPYGNQAGGAVISGLFSLAKSDVLEMVVGSQGGTGAGDPYHGNERGGGGGSFVRNVTTSTILLVAGGGGGQPSSVHGTACNRQYFTGQGQTGPVCGGMTTWCYTSVTPPLLGNGGANNGANNGGSGGGYNSSGANGGGHCQTGNGGGGFNNGMIGGAQGSCYGAANQGGFGGGGCGRLGTPGGGGGYTGGTVTGQWSSYSTWGGGGGSYNVGTMKTGVQGGNGSTRGGYGYAGYVGITRFPSSPDSYSSSTILTTGTLQTAAASLFTPTALLFRMSRDGTSTAAFHKACDGFAPIFIVIKATNGYIATAYTNVPFTSRFVDGYVTAAPGSNWLNNLWNGSSTSTTKYFNTNGPGNSLYDTQGYGPTFGGGHDMYIPNPMTIAYSNPSSYTIPNNSILFGGSGVSVSDIEVYFSSTPVSYAASTILTTGTLQSAALSLFTPSRLLFRMTRDGTSSSNFHTYCNGHAPIFIVMRATNGYIATSYTSVAYNNRNEYAWAPPNANWLNNLWNGSSTSTNKYYNNTGNSQYATYDTDSHGPTFGNGHDLYIPNPMTSGGYTNTPYAYNVPNNSTLFGSYSSWNLNEIEVYF